MLSAGALGISQEIAGQLKSPTMNTGHLKESGHRWKKNIQSVDLFFPVRLIVSLIVY